MNHLFFIILEISLVKPTFMGHFPASHVWWNQKYSIKPIKPPFSYRFPMVFLMVFLCLKWAIQRIQRIQPSNATTSTPMSRRSRSTLAMRYSGTDEDWRYHIYNVLPQWGKLLSWCTDLPFHYGLWLIYLYFSMVYKPTYNWGDTTLYGPCKAYVRRSPRHIWPYMILYGTVSPSQYPEIPIDWDVVIEKTWKTLAITMDKHHNYGKPSGNLA